MVCFYNVYFSLLFFISKTSKCYFRGTADQIPALGEQNSQAVTKLSSSGCNFVYIHCMYIFPLGLAVVDWPWFKWDYSSTWVRDSHFGYVHIHSRSMASNQQRYFRRSNTQTEPSDALAPTLSPAAFQQTSKIPPVPLQL